MKELEVVVDTGNLPIPFKGERLSTIERQFDDGYCMLIIRDNEEVIGVFHHWTYWIKVK